MQLVRKVFVLSMAAIALAWAQEDSRSAVIESARNEKEANLAPEVTPKGERRLESIERSVAYRLFSGDMDGFGIGVGSVIPGSAFAVMPSYRRTDLLGGRISLRLDALVAANKSYAGGIDLAMQNLWNDHAFFDLNIVHRDISEMPYYGPGPDSRKTGRSDYRLEDTNIELRPGFRVWKHVRASLIGSYLAINVGRGHSTKYISTDAQFSPAVTPGIERQSNFWRGGGVVEYNWLNRPSDPTSGGKYSAQYVRYVDQDFGRYSFLRLDLDAWQYIPLFNETHVFALHGASSLTDTNRTQQVPFYLQPTLGGPDTLRGYRFDRFYGNNSTMLSAEYRWDAAPLIQVVAFADGGKVFNDWQQWNFHAIETDVGFGFRFRGRTNAAFSLDTGFSHEGFQIWFRVNSAIRSRVQ